VTGTPPAEWTLPRLRVDRDGDWYDGDIEITHAGILANLRSSLQRDAGGYFIQTRVRIPVEVEDAPWVITRLERRDGALRARINDGSEEVIDAATIRIGPGDIPYAAVKGGAFAARFARAAAHQLLALAEYDEATERGTLRVGGREYALTAAPGERPETR
jgi:hypothetical protein